MRNAGNAGLIVGAYCGGGGKAMSVEQKIPADVYESIMDGITSGVWVADKNDTI